MRQTRTQSSIGGVPIGSKIREWLEQLQDHWRHRSPLAGQDFSWLTEELARYNDYTELHVGKALSDCKALEIGFGPRPYRLFGLHACGADVIGCDIDWPVLDSRDLLSVLRVNGFERALKSTARYFLFDVVENRQLAAFLAQEFACRFTPPRDRLVVADAASAGLWQRHPGPYDLIYSEDVFEHIPREDVRQVVEQMADALGPEGLALISPMIWTGIKGGHHVEYYSYQGGQPPLGPEPWDHLREAQFPVNTYLNRLTRQNYRDCFSEFFDIIEEREIEPGLGQELLTSDLRAELSDYSEKDLLSNKVTFVMRRKASVA